MQLTKSLLHTTDKYIQALGAAGIYTVEDFIGMYPRTLEDKSELLSQFTKVNITEKQTVACTIETIHSEKTRNNKIIIKAVLRDSDENYSEAVWFNRKFLLQKFHSGDRVVIYGMPKYEYGRLSFPSAEIEHYRENRKEIVPVYSDINYISGSWIREKMELLREYIINTPDTIPESIRTKKGFRTKKENIYQIHFPESFEEFERAKRELGYEELYNFQKIGIEKKHSRRVIDAMKSTAIPLNAELIKSLMDSLPFPLTNKQKVVLYQILKDMELSHPMSRMLQGDVGTGKTVVALLASIHTIIEGRRLFSRDLQVAIMAPTEILARQHFIGNYEWLESLGITSDLLVGSLTTKQKKEAKARLESGQTNIIFGTHALIQENVHFSGLTLAIVDEQHRFGVEQRKNLELYFSDTTKSVPHVLNMSATPIPRSLALTMYGDQDISVLNEYPAGRLPIHTRVVKESEREEVYRFIEEEVSSGRQAYWISPLVEESESLDIASATSMFELLEAVFPEFDVGLIHGKMSGKEKDAIMSDFYDNTIQILSSTSVVEVGVNNPNATIMCIEAAERFGLSQLHQFRGRVGRGNHQSYCYLFTTKAYKNDRLRAMEKTNDGFELAEIDLELRGPGEVYGVRQSGVPDMKFADLKDVDLIAEIREDIEEYMQMQQ